MAKRLEFALSNIQFARSYTLRLLDLVPIADWFCMPPGAVTHVAWQVGHLAVAEYSLVLARVRGPRPDDSHLMPESFRALFKRQSVAEADPRRYPSADEIRKRFDHVHDRVLADLPGVCDAELDTPLATKHMICKTKCDALRWCSHHEAIHAGQIGLIRRMLGYPPLW